MLEKDIALAAGNVDGRRRQRRLTGTLEDDAHLTHQRQIGVAQQGDAQTQLLRGGDEVSGGITADRKQVIPELRQLSCDFFQLDQLVAAESSPTAAVEDQDSRLGRQGATEVELLAR